MPKAPRSLEEIEAVREKIIATALSLIIDEGFSNLSMRKIAARLGITATTIYNYVASKDELNLMIRMKGFEILYRSMAQSPGEKTPENDLIARLAAMIRAYATFGITWPDYYDLMFSLPTPKYTDYIGTDIEETARLEKETSLRSFAIVKNEIDTYTASRGLTVDEETVSYLIIKIWSDLHGIISIFNSRVLYEVNPESRRIFDRRIDDCVETVKEIKAFIDTGSIKN